MSELKNQLIIVEGLTGLGKSTLAHFIERQYGYNGFDVRRIHEGEDPHPTGIEVEPDIDTFMAESLKKWGAFVADILDSGGVTVIEAGFLNNLIETLFCYCLDHDSILEYGMKMQKIIRPAKPALIYLTHPDTALALEENYCNRGSDFKKFVLEFVANEPISQKMGWNDDTGVVKFWSEFVAITDQLFSAYDIDKLAIDISAGDWESHNRQVTEFLGLSFVADPQIGPEMASKYVGAYQFKPDGKHHKIQYQNGVLMTNVFMNVWTKLIPKTESTFIVEKWHFELLFDFDQRGDAKSFVIGGRNVDYYKAVGLSAARLQRR